MSIRAKVFIGVGVKVVVGVPVGVGITVEVLTGTGVLVTVGRGMKVGVGVTVGETAGVGWTVTVALRVGVWVGVEVSAAAIPGGVTVTVGVPVGGVVHQGAVKEKPSSSQVRLPPPLQVVWKTFSWRPGWKSVPCPRSSGGGVNRFAVPIEMETAKLFGL